jgi:hypothetical protein
LWAIDAHYIMKRQHKMENMKRMTKLSKTTRLLSALRKSNSGMTIPQIKTRFGFASETAVTGVIARLRVRGYNEGFSIDSIESTRSGGRQKYLAY